MLSGYHRESTSRKEHGRTTKQLFLKTSILRSELDANDCVNVLGTFMVLLSEKQVSFETSIRFDLHRF